MTTVIRDQEKRRERGRKKEYCLLEARTTGWSLIVCKGMKRCVFLMLYEKRRRRIKVCSLLWGQALRSWIISSVAECRLSPPALTSGLDSSAHIHLFNLGKLHLMSYIVHWVKEQWVPLYSIVPPWPSGVILYIYDQSFVQLSPCIFTFSSLFCNYLTKYDYGL